MINFAQYYKDNFRKDINQFFSTIPDASRFHEDIQNKNTYSIQYERLTHDFDHLNFLNKEEKEFFGVALFFTILTDMVCYTHFKKNYFEFQQQTRYPKFIGNCPGGCHYHFHPSDIFSAMNFSRMKKDEILAKESLDFYLKFIEAVPTMKIEIKNFFKQNMKEINGEDFWNKCVSEFPYRVKSEF
jgi:hypothetical protein